MSEYNTQIHSINTDNLQMDYFFVPWDSETFKKPIAQISKIAIEDSDIAKNDLQPYRQWCAEQGIEFCSCRVAHNRIKESLFLETQGFRFMELNYQPVLNNLQNSNFPDTEIKIEPANDSDIPLLADTAETIFNHERFHIDPRVDTSLANKRYRIWLENGFKQQHQKLFKCTYQSKTVGFFLVEYPETNHCFWSLVGMLPEYQGRGLGKKVWQSMLNWHKTEGIEKVSTSISSNNIPIFNLYVALGFRFPLPYTTFHWTV